MPDPDALARRAARGDGEAFAALCAALQLDVWRYCLALTGDRELARDAAQETFLRAVTAIRRFRGDGPVRVWLLVLARRSVAATLDRERVRAARPVATPPERPLPDDTGAVDVHQLVAALPYDLAQAFVLTQMLGASYAEAAEVCGCRIGTIRSRVFRARALLVAQLDDRLDHGEEGRDGTAR